MSHFHQPLTIALVENEITIPGTSIQLLEHYLELLQRWNKVFNLTTITNIRDMVYLHLIDSLAVSPYLHGSRMLDVGSGAGLPGVPLAIIHPEQQWVLLDKNSKKTRFLTQVVAELELKNIEIIHSRSEEFHPAQQFDSILSRAFGTISFFIETCAHLLKPNGLLIAMKGKHPEEEKDDLPEKFCVQRIIRLNIKGVDIERHLVCLQKAV